jgi:hypothetical protein
MTRAELERLDRDVLVARAQAAGVTRAGVLTRPELVDELLVRSTPDPVARRRARGFFGVARDLLASVVELGLNLPDAADRIRTLGAPPPRRAGAPSALPTVTLAEIYAAQGHRERAVETLEGVLSREPDHAVARDLFTRLRDGQLHVPPPRMPPEPDEEVVPAVLLEDAESSAVTLRPKAPAPEPSHMLDDDPLPVKYDVDECVAIPVDPRTLYVYWEVRASTLDALRARSGGRLVLRVAAVEPSWEGPRTALRDEDLGAPLGDFFVRELPAGCIARVAVGWKSGETFVPVAHSPALETPPGAPSPFAADVLVRWTRDGAVAVQPSDPDAASIERALGTARRKETLERLAAMGGNGFLGSSERWMRPIGRVQA